MAPHLVLVDYIEVMKSSLSSVHPVVALAYRRCSRQHLDFREYAKWRYTIHLHAGYGHKWGVAPQVLGLAVLRC